MHLNKVTNYTTGLKNGIDERVKKPPSLLQPPLILGGGVQIMNATD